QQVVAAHAGLAGDAGGNNYDVGVGRGRIIVGPDHVHVALLDRHRFKQVERLALRHALHHVDQDHIGQFLGRNPVRGRGAHVAGAYNAYFLTHFIFSLGFNLPNLCLHYILPMMRVANSLVPTLVAPAVWRSKSYVTNFCRIVFSSEFSISFAASFQPMKSSSITPERITDPGLITSLSAY